jgi:uncharacterized protein YkwD
MANRSVVTIFTASVVLIVCCAIASGDVIYLNTGGVVKGKITERNMDSIVVVTEQGNKTTILLEDIEKIEEGASVEEMYKEKLSKVKEGDAEGHYQLGMWLKKVNYHKEAREEFEKAIILNPTHRFARAELGYVERKEGWVIPKEEKDEPWVHGLKRSKSRKRKVRRRRKKFDTKLLEGLPEDLANAANKLLEKEAAARAEAYKVLSGVTDEAVLEKIKVLLQAHHDRLLTSLESKQKSILRLLKGQTSKSLHDMQVKWFDRWEKARLEALKVIYDREVYPDENHGRSGQPKVDEKVRVVKKLWPYYDALVKAELSSILKVSQSKAASLLDSYDLLKRQLEEAQQHLKKLSLVVEEFQDAVTSVYRSLLSHRAKRYDAAWSYAKGLEDWEFRLYFRLRSLRILHYNDRIVKTTANAEERKLVQLTNDYRMKMGRLPVEIDERLVKCCKKHSQEMNRLGYFSHTSPTKGRETPGKRAALEGYEGGVGENIFTGMGSAGAAFNAWYNSSGHHRNMLGGGDPQRVNGKARGDRSQKGPNFAFGGWRSMGCGRDGNKFTEQFGGISSIDKNKDKKQK